MSISSKPKEIFPHLSIRKVKANEFIKGAETLNLKKNNKKVNKKVVDDSFFA